LEARVLKSTGSWYIIETSEGEVQGARLRGRLRQLEKKLTNPIAAGDRVVLSTEKDDEGNYAIEDIVPRVNYISRKATNLSKEMQLLAANIDTFYLIVTLRLPETHPLFIDRFLVAAESFRIPSVLLFNKTDLYLDKDKDRFEAWKLLYESLGYPCFAIQANDPSRLAFLRDLKFLGEWVGSKSKPQNRGNFVSSSSRKTYHHLCGNAQVGIWCLRD
jgi:ribosome biogenesis GTPase